MADMHFIWHHLLCNKGCTLWSL